MERFFRRVIQITAEDSPNVKLGLAQAAAGLPATGLLRDGTQPLPGVLSYLEYVKRRATWDPVRQCVGLDAQFWKGADALLYPPDWLNRCEVYYRWLQGQRSTPRRALGIGIDPGEGVAETTLYAVDEHGVIEGWAERTPDPRRIVDMVCEFIPRHGMGKVALAEGRCCMDRGGGGLQVASWVRDRGYKVRTVAFGEGVTPEPRRGKAGLGQRIEEREERYEFLNRRAQMYWQLRVLVDPARVLLGGNDSHPFGLPPDDKELRRQLAPMPLLRNGEGRLYLPPKSKPTPNYKGMTLEQILGCSPDRADGLVLAVHAMVDRPVRVKVGAR